MASFIGGKLDSEFSESAGTSILLSSAVSEYNPVIVYIDSCRLWEYKKEQKKKNYKTPSSRISPPSALAFSGNDWIVYLWPFRWPLAPAVPSLMGTVFITKISFLIDFCFYKFTCTSPRCHQMKHCCRAQQISENEMKKKYIYKILRLEWVIWAKFIISLKARSCATSPDSDNKLNEPIARMLTLCARFYMHSRYHTCAHTHTWVFVLCAPYGLCRSVSNLIEKIHLDWGHIAGYSILLY